MNFSLKLLLLLLIQQCQLIYIDDNFNLFLSRVCTSRINNVLFTKNHNNSLLRNYFQKNHCFFTCKDLSELNEEYSKEIRLKTEYELVIYIELNNVQELMSISYPVFENYYSMNVNFIIINKIATIDDILKIKHRFHHFRCHVVQYDQDLNHVTVYYIRPVINGCHSYNGILMSSEPNIKDLITSTNCNLNGSVLRVAANIVSQVSAC